MANNYKIVSLLFVSYITTGTDVNYIAKFVALLKFMRVSYLWIKADLSVANSGDVFRHNK